jgi:hypothetical protein
MPFGRSIPWYLPIVVVLPFLGVVGSPVRGAENTVEQWGLFEITLNGPAAGNPFLDVDLAARFTQGTKSVSVSGFYDGEGVYRVRFMPTSQGEWQYETTSNRAELNGKKGTFTATRPSAGNHGPVRVRNTYHFAYADGTPFFPIGTTCYAWTHQDERIQEQTLATLKAGPFNKLRVRLP